MNIELAETLAATLCGAFQASQETKAAYLLVIKDYDAGPMNAAVRAAMAECERMPTVKHLMGLYYAQKRASEATTQASGNVPCERCLERGGYSLRDGGPVYPPTAAVHPFIRGTRYREDSGKTFDVWPYPSSCPAHATEITRQARADAGPA